MSKFVADFIHGTVHEVEQDRGRQHKLVSSRKKLRDGYHTRYTLFRKLPS